MILLCSSDLFMQIRAGEYNVMLTADLLINRMEVEHQSTLIFNRMATTQVLIVAGCPCSGHVKYSSTDQSKLASDQVSHRHQVC